MPSTYTTNGGIQKPANGEQDGTWGDVVNVNMDILDRMTNGIGTITLSAATYTLTTTNGVASPGHYKVLILSGSPATAVTITVSPNTAQRWYFVRNACGRTVTFDQGSGATASIATGETKIIYCDGAGATAAVSGSLSNNLAITAGSINGSPIGANNPSTGAFTTLSATGAISFTGDFAVDTDVLFVDTTNNRVGINDATPSVALDVTGAANITGGLTTTTLAATGTTTLTGNLAVDTSVLFVDTTNNRVGINDATPSVALDVTGAANITGAATITGNLAVDTSVLFVDTTNNRVGINDATPSVALDVTGDANITGGLTVDTSTLVVDATNNYVGINTAAPAAGLHITDALDSVGAIPSVRLESTGAGSGLAPVLDLYRNSATPAASDNLGAVMFGGNNDAAARTLYSSVYGFISTTAAGSEAGGIGFQTRKSGTLTDRAYITKDGYFLVGKAVSTFALMGTVITDNGNVNITADDSVPIAVNRLNGDGNLIQFYQDGTLEGSISVSGTTVSFNGGHLSRWAQMPGDATPALLKGTVMTNLDEMSSWPGEDNEQLNRVAVSTVVGDPNVAGVFVAWEEGHDLRLAQTGDMVIRIASGVVVSRGDLLMSDGTGCAMAQGDDIVRSKTVAKVTSTNVSATYPDGSYCVPCVLMAC